MFIAPVGRERENGEDGEQGGAGMRWTKPREGRLMAMVLGSPPHRPASQEGSAGWRECQPLVVQKASGCQSWMLRTERHQAVPACTTRGGEGAASEERGDLLIEPGEKVGSQKLEGQEDRGDTLVSSDDDSLGSYFPPVKLLVQRSPRKEGLVVLTHFLAKVTYQVRQQADGTSFMWRKAAVVNMPTPSPNVTAVGCTHRVSHVPGKCIDPFSAHSIAG
ncbi:hypothetical protein Cadr_000005065 [Camelus dromedarius]|uniref:Uncharacterized protein n=1 Tax=Camelus dromedarius TaxID=9838 RepID=A0A5N4EB90_CAMDR|nr:hypothetical protein Cadr_000005065 [Camelus dromedarius]